MLSKWKRKSSSVMLLLVFQNVDETTDVSSRPQFPEEVRSAIGCSSQTFYKDLQLMRFF